MKDQGNGENDQRPKGGKKYIAYNLAETACLI